MVLTLVITESNFTRIEKEKRFLPVIIHSFSVTGGLFYQWLFSLGIIIEFYKLLTSYQIYLIL